MSEWKRMIPAFGCREKEAQLLQERNSGIGNPVSGQDMVSLARALGDHGADELLIADLSQTDQEHEKTIGTLKEVVRQTDVPVITGGYIKRLEDVKKYLYAGACAVFLESRNEEHIDLIKEAADRFGSEKIYMYLNDARQLDRIPEFAQLGASRIILDLDQPLTDQQKDLLQEWNVPFLFVTPQKETGFLTEVLAHPAAAGAVLTGSFADSDTDVCGGSSSDACGGASLAVLDCMQLKQQLKALGVCVDTFTSSISWDQFKLGENGLIPVIVQDYQTQEVLMLAYMNEEAFLHTLHTGKMTYFSRSRQSLWIKGETSGHYQYVKSLDLDCDNDTILAKVRQVGAACHTGSRSCFFQNLTRREYSETNPLKVFEEVFSVILDRKEHPKEGSYTNYLFDKGIDKILKKVGEEATEIIIAAKNPDPEEVKYEISDFLYHVMVLMAEKGVSWEDITKELANR